METEETKKKHAKKGEKTAKSYYYLFPNFQRL